MALISPESSQQKSPHWLSRGRLRGLLRADERGICLWTSGGIEIRDWGATIAAWSRSLLYRFISLDPSTSTLSLLTKDGLYLASTLGGELSWRASAHRSGLLATGGGCIAFQDPSGALLVHSWEAPLFRREVPAEILSLAVSSEGYVAVGLAASRSSKPMLWILEPSGEELACIEFAKPCLTLLFSSRDLLIAVHGRSLSFWTYRGHLAGQLEPQPGTPVTIAEDPVIPRLAVGYRGGPIALWNFPTVHKNGTYAGAVDGHQGTICGLSFLAGGAGLASVGEDQQAILWGLPEGRVHRKILCGSKGVEAAAYEPRKGRWLLGHEDGSVSVLEREGHPAFSVGQRSHGVFAVVWSQDGTLFASGGADGRIRIWGAKRGNLRAEVQGKGAVQALAFQRGALLVADEQGLGRWLLRTSLIHRREGSKLPLISRVEGGARGNCSAVIDLGGGYAVAEKEGCVWWSDPNGNWQSPIRLDGKLWSLAVSPNTRVLACGGEGILWLCDLRFGERLFSLSLPGGRLGALLFDATGEQIAVACQDGAIRILSLLSGKVEAELWGHTEEATGVFKTQDGLVSTGRDGARILWDQCEERRWKVVSTR